MKKNKNKGQPNKPAPKPANESVPSRPARSKSLANKIALAIVFPLLILGLVEGGLRIAGFQYKPREKILWKPTVSGFIGTYEFYIPTELSPPGYIWLSQPGTPYTDKYGFRLPEIPMEKPADKIRVAFLGGSTTHGGYRPYPERAIRIINDAIGTNRYEMLNVACSSYSTHQSVKAFDRWVLPRKPDIAVVYHGWNDVFLAVDGFSDKEKDPLLSITGKSKMTMPAAFRNLRLTGLLGKLAEVSDRTWPRQRVAFSDVEANLDHIAQGCASNDIKMIVMVRPEQSQDDLIVETPAPGSSYDLFARNTYKTEDQALVYKKQAEEITAVQRKIADRYDHVEAIDGQKIISDLIERNHRKEFGEQIKIFHSDNCHLYDFADELLAQQVALSIAPEHAAAISNHINSAAYAISMADELVREDSAREALWFIQQGLNRNPDEQQLARLQELKATAEGNIEFVDLFRAGRWGGSDPEFDSKIGKLKRCLQIRPTDYGVMTQIYRVCIYMNKMEEAAAAMARFTPQTGQQQYEWLQYTLESHLQGQRYPQARRIAELLVKMNPQHPLANSVLQQIPATL